MYTGPFPLVVTDIDASAFCKLATDFHTPGRTVASQLSCESILFISAFESFCNTASAIDFRVYSETVPTGRDRSVDEADKVAPFDRNEWGGDQIQSCTGVQEGYLRGQYIWSDSNAHGDLEIFLFLQCN